MSIIVDSSFLAALYNDRDPLYRRALALTVGFEEEFVVPNVVLPEVAHTLRRRYYYPYNFNFLDFLNHRRVSLETLTKADLPRIAAITDQYPTANFDLVDCCVMAIAERRKITRIATFDTRDFGFYRPRHCDYFELLP